MQEIGFIQFHLGDPGTFDITSPKASGDVTVTVVSRNRVPEEAGILRIRHYDDPNLDIYYVKRALTQKMADALMEFCDIVKTTNCHRGDTYYELQITISDFGRLSGQLQSAENKGFFNGINLGKREVLNQLPQFVDDFGNIIPRKI